MKRPLKTPGLLCVLLLGLGASSSLSAQVSPVLSGAVSTNAGSKLAFLNHAEIASTSSYVHPLIHQAFANRIPATNIHYFATDLLFTALSSTNETGAAAIGANLVCEVVSVAGPAGATFAFWEQGSFWPTYSFPVGGTYAAGKNRFDVSDIAMGAGRPDGDPFGAIPGRRFSVTHPGEYLVTFTLHDISENHPTSEAPIHAPSDPLTLRLQTEIVLSMGPVSVTNGNETTVYFQPGGFTNVVVEAKTLLDSDTWVPVAGPLASVPVNANYAAAVFTNDLALPSQYYRVRLVE